MATKYRITELVDNLPRSFNVSDALVKAEITERTFYRDKAIKQNSTSTIPSDRLRKYATMFGCSMEELYTPTRTLKAKAKASKFATKLS